MAMLCATFPTVPEVTLTATASKRAIADTSQSPNLKNPLEVLGNPNRPNITQFEESLGGAKKSKPAKHFLQESVLQGDDMDFFEDMLKPIAHDLKEQKVDYRITIIYLPLRWCGFAYKYFDKKLGHELYFPSANRLFAQYHAPHTSAIKDQILDELSSSTSKIRLICATVAMMMDMDIKSIRQVIHVGPPCTIRKYFQETWYAGHDRKQSFATIYYDNRDTGKNQEELSNISYIVSP